MNLIEIAWANSGHEPTLHEPSPRLEVNLGNITLRGYVQHVDERRIYCIAHEELEPYQSGLKWKATRPIVFDVEKVFCVGVWEPGK